ncbi:MAG: hypothetical protein AAGE85_13700 [Pseudomonadota bacterium]
MSDAPDRGITVSEIAAMDQPVDVTPVTTAAFVGRALRGPLNTPVLVENVAEYRRRFGDTETDFTLGPAVRDFFEQGGRRLHVVRVANGARGAMICLPANGTALVLRALEPGSSETLRAAVDYDAIDDDEHFNLTLQRIDCGNGHVLDQEYLRRVSADPQSTRSVHEALLSSELARSEAPYPAHRPEATAGFGLSTKQAYVEHAQAGSDGAQLSDYDLIGSRVAATGLFALDKVDRFDVLYLPPFAAGQDTGPAALLAAEMYCRQRNAMLIVDPAFEWKDPESAVAGLRRVGYASPNMLSYYPRLRDMRRSGCTAQSHAAGGALAGLLCKLDASYGPWGSSDGHSLALQRHYQPVVELDEEDCSLLARAGLNCLTLDSTRRLRLSGNRTLARGTESLPRHSDLRVRRLCLMLINVIDQATRWAVFERPDERLAMRIQSQVYAGLQALAELGALDDETFDVRCRVDPSPPAGSYGVDVLLSFTPRGSDAPLSLTLNQSAAGCSATSTAFAPVPRRAEMTDDESVSAPAA